MNIGLSLGITSARAGDASPVYITSTLAPAMSVLRPGDSVNDVTNYATMVSTGNYSSTEGTISSAVVAFTGDAVSAGGALADGDVAGFTVTVTDSAANERVFNAGQITVVYGAAVNTVLPAVTGDTGYDDTLSVSNGTWTGATGGAFSYQWQRDGVDISGATSNTYTLTVDDSGADIRAIVTYTNSGGAVPAASNTVTADTLTSAAVAADLAISGTTTVGQTLSLTGGAVTGNPTPTVTFQWLRGGVAISGATSATYTLVEADEGENISCTKSATNVIGSDSDTSDAVAVTYAAPSADGGIADQSYTEDSAITTLDVSSDFTGSGITYALAPSSAALPTGLSLASNGQITGTPTTVAAQVNIIVRGTNSGGFDDTAFGITITSVVSGDTSLTTGSVEWSWINPLATGTDATGRAYIVKADGSETLAQPTPAQVSDGGDVAGGVMKNPARTGSSSQAQGFDERVNAGNYDAAKNETGSVAMTAGDRLVKAVPASVGSYSDSREPFASEYQVLHCVSSAPGSDDVLAPTVQFSGATYPEKYTVNWTTLLGKFQNRDASAISLTLPSHTEVMAQLNKQAPMYAYNNATSAGSGYERMMPAGFHGATISTQQYGRYISQLMSVIAVGLHYDTWTESQKTEILKKLVGLGVEWGFPLMDAGSEVGPDGGHNQFSQFPTIVALVACGREADVATFFGDSGGGNWDQYFNVTNTLIASDLSQHTSTARPILWYEQTLPAQPGGNFVRIPAASQVNNNQTEIPVGSRVMRKGAFGGIHVATVTATKQLASAATNDVAINAQPDVAFASSDVVWFEAPPVSVYDGAVDWTERSAFGPSGNSSSPERYTPSAGNEYRGLQAIAGAVAGVAGMGYLHEDMRAVWSYVERAHAADEPASDNDYPTPVENWQNSTSSYSLAPIFDSQTERAALGLAVSEYEASAPTVLTIQHIAHPSATVSGNDDLLDGQVIGVVDDLTQQAVKIAGVATGGDKTPVEVRVVEDGDSSVVQDWTHLGWIDNGTFEGSIVLPVGTDWYNFEVRSLRDTGVTSTPTERVGVGHKIMVIGQSQARIWSTGNAATGLTMTSAYENTASIYGWNDSASIAEYITMIDDTVADGPRAFVEQARALGVTAPIQIVMETKNGTSIVDFLDDSDAGRDFSDLTDKTSKYGKDFTSVIEWWDTSNASPLDGDTDIETLFGIEDHTTGAVADHGLNEELLPGFKAVIQLASRHASAGGDIGHAGSKVDYFNGSPKMPLTLGWPLADYETDGTGPHADIAAGANGNIYGGYRMALGHVEAVGGTSFTKSYLAGTAERNSTGNVITVPVTLENGGTLGTEGSEVTGFEVSQDGGSSWSDRNNGTHPFTATVDGSNVLITKDSGTWATNTSLQVRKQGRLEENPNGTFSAALETEIIEGELYETGVTNVKGPGLPVHGLNSGSWTYGPFATITSVSQEAGAVFTPNGISNGGTRYMQANGTYSPGTMGKTGTISVWLKDARQAGNPLQMRSASNQERVLLRSGSTGNLLFRLWNSSGTKIGEFLANGGALGDDLWTHVLISWDLAAGSLQLALNDTLISSWGITPSTVNDNVENCDAIGVFSDVGGDNRYKGDISEFFMDKVYRDLSVVSNRRDFIDASGGPVDLDGLGSPHLLLTNAAASFATNNGSGGNLVEAGTGSFSDVTGPS